MTNRNDRLPSDGPLPSDLPDPRLPSEAPGSSSLPSQRLTPRYQAPLPSEAGRGRSVLPSDLPPKRRPR
jgi:hypothetical protein